MAAAPTHTHILFIAHISIPFISLKHSNNIVAMYQGAFTTPQLNSTLPTSPHFDIVIASPVVNGAHTFI